MDWKNNRERFRTSGEPNSACEREKPFMPPISKCAPIIVAAVLLLFPLLSGPLAKAGLAQEKRVSALIEAFKDKKGSVREEAALALGQIGPSAVPALIEALQDKNGRVREGAAAALGHIGPGAKSAVPALIEALKDKDASVHREAAFALGQIGPDAKAAVPALVDAFKDKNGSVRDYAAFALGKIGPSAVSSLLEALKDKDKRVHGYAALALSEIAWELKRVEATDMIEKLEMVKMAVKNHSNPIVKINANTLESTVKYLKVVRDRDK